MNKYKFTYKNTSQLYNIIYRNGSTKNQPIDCIMIGDKLIVIAVYNNSVIYVSHMPAVFKLDTSRISPDKLEGKKVYMNELHVTDGLICTRFGLRTSNEIFVSIGPKWFDESTYIVCRLIISSVGVNVQNQTNSYNVRAEYNEDTKTLYLTDEAEEA